MPSGGPAPLQAVRWAWLLSAALCGPSQAAPAAEALDPQTLSWLYGNFGAVRGATVQRPGDPVLDWLERKLPELKQTRIVANAKRSWMLIESGAPACHVGAVRNRERERVAYFTNIAVFPAPHVYVRKASLASVPRDAAGEVKLPELLDRTSLVTVLGLGRSYGQEIDAWLAKRGPNPAVQVRASSEFADVTLPQLSAAQIDYVIEYPHVVSAFEASHPEVQDLVALPIARADKMLTLGAACPRTPWGLNMIRQVDRALATPDGVAMLKDFMERQWSRSHQRLYADRVEAFFAERSRPTPGL